MNLINSNDTKKAARLAKLSFDEDTEREITAKLNSIMVMIDELQNVNCDGVEPLRSVLDMQQRFAEDQVLEKDISDDLFSNIPKSGSNLAKEVKCFVVPKVVE